jgi:hypothetical protein
MTKTEIADLTALQEDILLEEGLELWRESQEYKERHNNSKGLFKCEFCSEWVEEELKGVTIDEGERVKLCESCYNEVTEFDSNDTMNEFDIEKGVFV